ncbi:hypothetical protein QQX98_007458 [Neonectria punicea]|uniref:Uncharacterized protein n=1 Tax=Neonectria punicea TaxID=979145 RepID=A0ABR1GXY5_9HYPO
MVNAHEMLLGVGEKSTEESWLGIILRKELVEINLLLPDLQYSDCLLANIGEYLCRATDTLAQLAGRLANGNHIDTYAQRNVMQAEKETDLSELAIMDIMTAKHSALKTLAQTLKRASEENTLTWHKGISGSQSTSGGGMISPEGSSSVPLQADWSSHSEVGTELARAPSVPSEGSSSHHAQPPTTENDDLNNASFPPLSEPTDSMIMELIQGMNRRGKGVHYCPFGEKCSKGGVSDGTLLLFERNSAFK